ncbi:MAG TPA: hypothetical protein VGS19_13795, partial [Streptosporangiaceae bacterium]|nr:hypothetical protein [Streptosporangiaceae bacterium]
MTHTAADGEGLEETPDEDTGGSSGEGSGQSPGQGATAAPGGGLPGQEPGPGLLNWYEPPGTPDYSSREGPTHGADDDTADHEPVREPTAGAPIAAGSGEDAVSTQVGDEPGTAVAVIDGEAPGEPAASGRAAQARALLVRVRHRLQVLGRRLRNNAGQTFGVVTAVPCLVITAWLVPGAGLLLGGRFLPVPMVLIAAPLTVALVMLVVWSVPHGWLGARTGKHAATADTPSWTPWWGLGGTLVVAVGFAVWQILVNSPEWITSRDPGALTQFGYWIAQKGSVRIPQTASAFGGGHPGLTFATFGFASQGHDLVPQFMAGLPIVASAGLWAHGALGAAVISPVLGALALISVGGLTGRLAGPAWAPAGALLLALTVPQIYTSRSAFDEPLTQALLFGGLCLVVDSLRSRRPVIPAALGGLALGLTVLADLGSLVLLLPVIPFLGALIAGRRPQAWPFAGGLVVGVDLGLAAGFVLVMRLMHTTIPSLGLIGIVACGFVAVTAAGVAIGLLSPARRMAARILRARPLRWLPDAGAAAVGVLALLALLRPYIQTVRGPANGYIAALQRLEHLPVDPGRLYAEKSFYWLFWYLGVPALLLGLVGLAIITRRCLRALVTWRDPRGVARAWALPAAIFGWGLLVVLWQPDTVPDQPWASRRLVPVALPGLVVLAVWVAARLTARARSQGAGVVVVAATVACFVVALGVPPAALTFGIGASHAKSPAVRLALTGLALKRANRGEFAAVQAMCQNLPARSSVVLLDETAARRFAQAIRG